MKRRIFEEINEIYQKNHIESRINVEIREDKK